MLYKHKVFSRNNNNVVMTTSIFSAVLAVVTLTNPVLADSLQRNMNILRPLPEVLNHSFLFSEDQDSNEGYITRRGAVKLDVDQLLPQMPANFVKEESLKSAFSFVQQTFVMDFFPDRSILIIIDQESHPSQGVVSLSAHTIDQDIATVSMTITEESYLITFQDVETNTLYRVVGNSVTGVGSVTEIDISQLPQQIHLPSIIVD